MDVVDYIFLGSFSVLYASVVYLASRFCSMDEWWKWPMLVFVWPIVLYHGADSLESKARRLRDRELDLAKSERELGEARGALSQERERRRGIAEFLTNMAGYLQEEAELHREPEGKK